LAHQGGLYQTVAATASSPAVAIPANQLVGCAISGGLTTGNMGKDFAFIPAEDLYHVSTSGYMDGNVARFPAGNPYGGKIRIDRGMSTIAPVSRNLCDNAARRARNDTTFNIVTYVIGLGSSVDHNLLRRMANDLSSPTYDNTKVAGLYGHAPTLADIGAAYARIAGEVLRLSQ
jgi:hypothetical protein